MVRPITHGDTGQSVVIRIIDSTDGTPETGVVFNTSGIDLWYRREGAASVDITEATLSALTDAHADGGFLHINDGYYRLDVPDAAFASGADGVMIGGAVTGMIVIGCYVPLVAYDPQDATRLGLTALPNAAADAAGGLPISDAGGLDLDGMSDAIDSIGFIVESSDADIDAIKAKTDSLTFTTANKVDATIQAAADFAQVAADKVWSSTTRTLSAFGFSVTVGTNNDKTGYSLSAAGIQAIWDALTSALTTVGSIGKWIIDNLNATVSSRSSHSASDVTGGTTVAAGVTAIRGADSDTLKTLSDQADLLATAAALATVDTVVDAIKTKTDNLPGSFAKNVALSSFVVVMRDSSGDPATGLTVSGQISQDGGALGALTNAVSELSNGIYVVDLTQAEMNADIILLRFTATGADDLLLMLKTDA